MTGHHNRLRSAYAFKEVHSSILEQQRLPSVFCEDFSGKARTTTYVRRSAA